MPQFSSSSQRELRSAVPPSTSDQRQPGTPIPLRVGILSNGDPDDVRTWSGVPWSMKRELAKRFVEVHATRSTRAPGASSANRLVICGGGTRGWAEPSEQTYVADL